MLVLGGRAADLRRSRRHHRPAGRRAGRRELRQVGGARRSGDRDQPDAQPAGLHRRARHRARPRRRRHGQVQGEHAEAGRRHVPLPGRGDARFRRDAVALPGFALRLVRGVKNGPSPEWLQRRLTAIGLRPINALVDITNFITYDRGRPLHVFDAAKVHGNLTVRRAGRRSAARARRQDLHARRNHLRDRRREGRRIARRHHGRRGVRLLGDDHRRADRVGAVGAAQHRADRPQARHQLGRALSLRARRRSGLHAAGARACHPDGARPVRRHAVRGRGRRQGGSAGSHHRLPARRSVSGSPASRSDCPRSAACSAISASSSPARRDRQGRGAVVAAGRARQGRHRRGGGAHPRRRPRPGDAVPARRRAAQAGADADPGAHPQGQARARRARAGRGRHLVVRLEAAGRAVRRRQAGAGARQSDRGGPLRHAAEPAPGPGRRRAEERRPRLSGRRAVRGRADLQGRPAAGSVHRRAGVRRARAKAPGIGRHWSGPASRRRRVRRQGGCARGARRRRRAGCRAAGRARRPGLVPSGTLRHDPDRAAERARPFRRTASAHAGGARRRRSAGRLRGDPRQDPGAEGQGDARQADAGAVAVPAGRARLRLRGRPRA